MKNLKLFKQSRGDCGPASLKMVLSVYGVNKSEKEFAKLTKSSRDKGCDEIEIVNVAKKLGFKSYVKQNSNIDEFVKNITDG